MLPHDLKTRLQRMSVGVADVRELLTKGWLTHDALWFAQSTQDVGVHKTNEINVAAVRAMARVEAERVKSQLGLERVTTPEELASFVAAATALIKPRFMRHQLRFLEPAVLRLGAEDGHCFAFRGIQRLGLLDDYRCATWVRVEAWLDALHLPFVLTPDSRSCLMHETGRCERTFRVRFPV